MTKVKSIHIHTFTPIRLQFKITQLKQSRIIIECMGHYQCKCFKNTKSGSLPTCSCASRYCPVTAHTAEAGVSREKLRATLSSHTSKNITPPVASSHRHQKKMGVEKRRQGRGQGFRKIKMTIYSTEKYLQLFTLMQSI